MTRVGVLECDHVDGRYRSICGDYLDMFAALLDLDLVPYDVVNGALPVSVGECDVWLATGSRFSVYDAEPWIARASEFVRDIHAAGSPLVGVCFGHQLLAHALGGRVEHRGWNVGAIDTHLDEQDLVLLYMHHDQVTALPDGARVAGSHPSCDVAAFEVGTSRGIQAHPEFSPAYIEALLDDRAERIGRETVTRAKVSLARCCDSQLVGAAMREFLAR